MPRYTVRRTRVLRLLQTTEVEVVARNATQALAKVENNRWFETEWTEADRSIHDETSDTQVIR